MEKEIELYVKSIIMDLILYQLLLKENNGTS